MGGLIVVIVLALIGAYVDWATDREAERWYQRVKDKYESGKR